MDLALLDLQNGRIDAVVSDAPVLRYMTKLSFHGLRTIGDQFTDEKLGVVLARGSDDLRRAVNAALWKMEDSGEYARVYRQWFGETPAAGAGAPAAGTDASRLFDPALVSRTWRFLGRGVWVTAVLPAIGLVFGLPIGLPLALARVKDSSLVSVIGLRGLGRAGQELGSRYAAPLTIWPMVALLYLLLTFPLTQLAEELERRWRPVARG